MMGYFLLIYNDCYYLFIYQDKYLQREGEKPHCTAAKRSGKVSNSSHRSQLVLGRRGGCGRGERRRWRKRDGELL